MTTSPGIDRRDQRFGIHNGQTHARKQTYTAPTDVKSLRRLKLRQGGWDLFQGSTSTQLTHPSLAGHQRPGSMKKAGA